MTDTVRFAFTDGTVIAQSFKDYDLTNDMSYDCTMTALDGLEYDLYFWNECDEWLCVLVD